MKPDASEYLSMTSPCTLKAFRWEHHVRHRSSPLPPEHPSHLQSNNERIAPISRHIFKGEYVRVDEMEQRKIAMPVQIVCPNLRCRKLLSVPDDARGKIVKCHHCQTV